MVEKMPTSEEIQDPLGNYIHREHTDKHPYVFQNAIPTGMFKGENLKPVTFYREEKPRPHWHVVTNGFNSHGFELTTRMPRDASDPDRWPQRAMQDLYAYVTSSGEAFRVNDYMEYVFDVPESSRFVGTLFVEDPTLKAYERRDRQVMFLQVFPLTATELEKAQGDDFEAFIGRVREATGGFFIIDWQRAEIA